MRKSTELQCPKCLSSNNLARIESILGLALITVNPKKKTWTYDGETKIDWNSQSREMCKDLYPEFECRTCGTEFNVEGTKEKT